MLSPEVAEGIPLGNAWNKLQLRMCSVSVKKYTTQGFVLKRYSQMNAQH